MREPKQKRRATPWYGVLVECFEARRYAVGLSMAAMDRLMGCAERSYAKMIHPDSVSGRSAGHEKLQQAICVLWPDGFELAFTPAMPGSKAEGKGVENSEGSRRMIRAETAHWHRPTRREYMRELAQLGGKARSDKLSDDRIREIAIKASNAARAARAARAASRNSSLPRHGL